MQSDDILSILTSGGAIKVEVGLSRNDAILTAAAILLAIIIGFAVGALILKRI